MCKVLICDDQPDIVNALKIYLKPEGYELITAANGKEALELARTEHLDLILMDVMMPNMDGITATDKIREFSNVPIILLTAKSETEDVVLGLNVGADDYITKPFVPVEVMARVRSQLRRYGMQKTPAPQNDNLVVGGIELNDREKIVTVDGDPVGLTPIEYAILKLFMQNPGRALSREDILSAVWGRDYEGELKIVDVNIRRLRIKIEDDTANPCYITTVWGLGYKWGG
jgi:DNA-binding response OmpR family regulator